MSNERQVMEAMQATGPWFVLTTPTPHGGRREQFEPNNDRLHGYRCENEVEAGTKARDLIREGYPEVFIGRALYRAEVPIQMTQLVERKPETPEVEEPDEDDHGIDEVNQMVRLSDGDLIPFYTSEGVGRVFIPQHKFWVDERFKDEF